MDGPSMRPKKAVLLVDDNEQELSVLKVVLTTKGYRILTAANAAEAVLVFTHHDSIDLVIARFDMLTPNGTRLDERLKRVNARVPIILLGDPEEMSVELHPADALLDRKISPTELLGWIKSLTARKRGRKKKVWEQPPPAPNQLAAASV